MVVGRVRRRFFRAAGAAASRVEVEADVVARARDRRRVEAALRARSRRSDVARAVTRARLKTGIRLGVAVQWSPLRADGG